MSEMTTSEAIEVLKTLKKRQDVFIKATWHKDHRTHEEMYKQALDKAIEVMGESVSDKLLEKHREEFKPKYNFIEEE